MAPPETMDTTAPAQSMKPTVPAASSTAATAAAPAPASQAATAATGAVPGDSFAKEIRYAVVMYGGVSLAVYINGVAQELLRMVRGTAPARGDAMTFTFRWKPDELTGTERVYREIGAALEARFVVDILSGTSAGGINALYLAKALVRDRSLDDLKKLWVEEAEITKLLNDASSLQGGLSGDLLDEPPQSVLNGQRFYWLLLNALDQMDAAERRVPAPSGKADAVTRSPYTDEIDLFITATDFDGVKQPLPLDDVIVQEPVHRQVFHFAYHQPVAADPPKRNDFQRDDNPILSFAARCTASFPGAFAPVKLEDIDPILRSLDDYKARVGELGSSSPRWIPFFKGTTPAEYKGRYFVDGGYLDNKPFESAVGALGQRRRPLMPVERKLVYIEPDPEVYDQPATQGKPDKQDKQDKPDKQDKADRPDLLASVAAVDALPRVETIRKDLEAVNRRNQLINRAWVLTAGLEQDVQSLATGKGHSKAKNGNLWALEDLADLIRDRGVAYGGYHRLKISRLTDWLASIVQNAAQRPDGKAFSSGEARDWVRLWRERSFTAYYKDDAHKKIWAELQEALDVSADQRTDAQKALVAKFDEGNAQQNTHAALGLPATENRMLMDFDVAYRVRRLEFVRLKLRELVQSYSCAEALAKTIGHAAPDQPSWLAERQQMVELQVALQPRHQELLDLEIQIARPPEPPVAETPEAVMGRVRDQLTKTLFEVGTKIGKQLATPPTAQPGTWLWMAGEILRHFYNSYDDFDFVRFPVLHCMETQDLDEVKVIRVSAADTTLAGRQGVAKLAGAKVGHFGAFLDEKWRRNDILWGRLDGAERMITTLARSHPSRDKWLVDAFIAIIQEELADELPAAASAGELARQLVAVFEKRSNGNTTPAGPLAEDRRAELQKVATSALATSRGAWGKVLDGGGIAKQRENIVEFLKEKAQNDPLPPERTLEIAGRATAIIRKVMGGVANGRGHAGSPGVKWGLSALSVVMGLVELATPKSLVQVLLRYWLQLAMLAGALLAGVGIVFGLEGQIKIGAALFVLAGVVRLAADSINAVVFGTTKRMSAGAAVAGLALSMAGGAFVLPYVNGAPEGSPFTMIDFEMARSPERAATLLGDWAARGLTEPARTAVHWDFLFILAYVGLGISVSWLVGAFLSRSTAIRGSRVAWALTGASLLAGLCDVAENGILLWLLDQGPAALTVPELAWYARATVAPPLAFFLASLKFGLVFVVIVANGGGFLIAAGGQLARLGRRVFGKS